MFENPLVQLGYFGAALYILFLWSKDYRAQQSGETVPGALPGAYPASRNICLLAVGGALILLALETLGEYQFGLVEAQTEITVLFGLVSLGAAIIEEVIFRGYLVITKKGRAVLVASIIGFSLVFTLAHPFFWEWTVVVEANEAEGIAEQKGLIWDFSGKAWFTSVFLFLNSLWFYTVRFLPANQHQSLIPCFLAHAVSNLGVFMIKGGQGFVTGWW